jgi:nucleotide-binding universal stress UspA family protein
VSFQRILVAVDAGPIAARAVDVAVDLARSLRAELAFVHAVDPSVGYGPESGVSASEFISTATDRAKQLIASLRERAKVESSTAEFVPVGQPAGEVVKTAREWTADLIVIGSHGRGGVKRVLLGSVAEEVMRQAPCPVLVIRADA